MFSMHVKNILFRLKRKKKAGEVSSMRRYLLAGWAVTSGLMLTVFLIYGLYSILGTTEELTRSNKIVASHYAQQLNRDIDSMKGYVDRIYSENVQFQTLKRPYLSEPEWYSSAYYLANSLEGRAGIIDYFGGVFFYDAQKETLRSQYSEFSHKGDNYRLNLCLKACLEQIRDETWHEGFFVYEGETYLIYMKGVRQKMVGFVLNLNSYYSDRDELVLAFYDDDAVLEIVGDHLREQEVSEIIGQKPVRRSGYIVAAEPIHFKQMQINEVAAGCYVGGYDAAYIKGLVSYAPESVQYKLTNLVGNSSLVLGGWMISSVCKNPDAAMKLLYLMTTEVNC